MTTFKRFDIDDIVRANPTEVTLGLWTGNTGSLVSFYSQSSQTAATSGQYYFNVFNINPSSSDAEVQFAVAYGHRTGGGAPTLNDSDTATLSTQAIYSQYRNLLLDPGDSRFTFEGSYSTDHIYVINVTRQLLKERMDPGNWMLKLTGASGSFTLIDDSEQTLGAQFGRAGQVFNVVSGSLSGSTGSTIANHSGSFGGYGLFYPSLGVIVLNPDAISRMIGMVSGGISLSGSTYFAPVTGASATHQYNHAGLYNAIRSGGDFQARSAETISSTMYFVRARNKEFNYSNNPTFFNENDGTLVNTDFIKNPIVYPTTVGLYNDSNELLAVAKLSKPVQKSFDKEILIRVRLDW